jgi:hypothetical protein
MCIVLRLCVTHALVLTASVMYPIARLSFIGNKAGVPRRARSIECRDALHGSGSRLTANQGIGLAG